MLGERVATEITINKDAEGFIECKDAAKQGGEVAGNVRIDAENRIGNQSQQKTIINIYLKIRKKRLNNAKINKSWNRKHTIRISTKYNRKS